ncbi:hypothetical protein Tco_0866804 [Tanacetum coccineum]
MASMMSLNEKRIFKKRSKKKAKNKQIQAREGKDHDYQQYDVPTSSEQNDDLLFEKFKNQHTKLNTNKCIKELRGDNSHLAIGIVRSLSRQENKLSIARFLGALERGRVHIRGECLSTLDFSTFIQRQTRRPRSDRGKARHSISSTSAHHNRGSSSHRGDDDDNDGASRASTPSPTT